jgi:hypothetical protein
MNDFAENVRLTVVSFHAFGGILLARLKPGEHETKSAASSAKLP